MKLVRKPEELAGQFGCCVATVGNFDGVHLGHREILSRVRHKSKYFNCPSILITFDPHPSAVLYPGRDVSVLTTLEDKVKYVRECGIDFVLALEFTLDFAQKDPLEFVDDVLVPLKVRELYVGHDFLFGSGRKGDSNWLAAQGAKRGFAVYEIDPVKVEGERVGSSLIRALISKGDVEKAARFLGRPHSVRGKVVEGAGRGREIGFPTCNLGTPEETVPGPGIYATRTRWRGGLYDSATHIGVIPTFDVDVPGIESHLLEFSGEMLGDEVEILFYKKLRDTVKFDSAQALSEQIRKDCLDARLVLKNA